MQSISIIPYMADYQADFQKINKAWVGQHFSNVKIKATFAIRKSG